jgi:3'-5' exoribonuclease
MVEHLIISHHGQYEFGSPKLPMFPEALMLHYLDDLDSKMESMRAHLERESQFDEDWTGYNASLGRPLLNTRKFLAPKPPAESAPVVDSAAQSAAAAAAPATAPLIPAEAAKK